MPDLSGSDHLLMRSDCSVTRYLLVRSQQMLVHLSSPELLIQSMTHKRLLISPSSMACQLQSKQRMAVADVASRSLAPLKRFQNYSPLLCVKLLLALVAVNALLSVTSTSHVTLKPRSWSIATAMRLLSLLEIAHFSVATKSSLKKHRHHS